MERSDRWNDATAAALTGAVKRYGEVTALDGIDLVVQPGETLALLGPNGAGKTTAVKLLLGLTRPDGGRALLFGGDPRDRRNRWRLGTMLQIAKVPETLTVREHVELFSSYYPSPRPLGETLAAAGLEHLEDRAFGKLSGGERQRLLFALALCGDPELLVLDEPTAGLDVSARRGLWKEIRRFVGRRRSVLLTTHHLEEADALADRIVVIHRGRVLAEGPPRTIKARFGGRRIRCITRTAPSAVGEMPGVSAARWNGPVLEVFASEAEPIVRALLARDPHLDDLEVTSASLEEAFLALTEADSEPETTLREGAA
jgi:ABC-2 type transport system ATP-binding protein